jgi:tetratricopeptide (TPR) repeat protein
LIDNKETWSQFAIISKKTDHLSDFEEAIIRCYEIDKNDLNLKVIYSVIKWLKGRTADAINFLQSIITEIGIKNTSANFNIFLAYLYKESGKELLFNKHIETAKRFKMRELNLIPPVGQKSKLKLTLEKLKEKKTTLTDEQYDQIFYAFVNILNEYHIYEASDKILDYIANKASTKYLIERSKIYLAKQEYDKVIEITNEIIGREKPNYTAYLLRGNAYYFKKNIFDSEESYVKAIRFKSEGQYNITMLYRLGMTYIKRKTWSDAKTVFQHILKDNPGYAFAWRYLGLAYMRLGEYESAEESLNEANLLDIENPQVWGYLTILCILMERKNQALECLNEFIKGNYNDLEMLEEIGDLFFKIGEYELTAELYTKILNLDPKNINVHINLADVYFHHVRTKRNESIDILKNSLKYAEDENDKKRIADFIEAITRELGYHNGGEGDFDLSNLEKKTKTEESDFNMEDSEVFISP